MVVEVKNLALVGNIARLLLKVLVLFLEKFSNKLVKNYSDFVWVLYICDFLNFTRAVFNFLTKDQ